MFGIGPTELLIILVILILLFGASRIPQLARSLGKASKEFKKGTEEAGSDIEEQTKAKSNRKKRKKEKAKV